MMTCTGHGGQIDIRAIYTLLCQPGQGSNTSFAWGVSFYDGKVDYYQKGDSGRVRLVRNGETPVPIDPTGAVKDSRYP